MLDSINLGQEDDGKQEFEFNGNKVKIDILEVCTYIFKLKEIQSQFTGEENTNQNSYIEDIRKYLEDKGFVGITIFSTIKFIKYVNVLAEQLKKNIELIAS